MTQVTCSRCGRTRGVPVWPLYCSCGLRTNEDGSVEECGLTSMTSRGTCQHRGEVVRSIECRSCGRRHIRVPVFACALHGECTTHRIGAGSKAPAACLTCPDFRAENPPPRSGIRPLLAALAFVTLATFHPR